MARNATEREQTLGRRGGRKLIAKEFMVTQENIPAEQKLAEPAMTEEDHAFEERVNELKDEIRKRTIQKQIFEKEQSAALKKTLSRAATVAKTKENSVIPGVTCDFSGKPLKINTIKKFPKRLLFDANVTIPRAPTQVEKSPEKIQSIMEKSNYYTSLGKGPLKAFQQIQTGGEAVHFDPATTNMSKMTKMTRQTSGPNRTANNTEFNTSYNFG